MIATQSVACAHGSGWNCKCVEHHAHTIQSGRRASSLGFESYAYQGPGARDDFAGHSSARIASQKVVAGQMRLTPEIGDVPEARPARFKALVAAFNQQHPVADLHRQRGHFPEPERRS